MTTGRAILWVFIAALLCIAGWVVLVPVKDRVESYRPVLEGVAQIPARDDFEERLAYLEAELATQQQEIAGLRRELAVLGMAGDAPYADAAAGETGAQAGEDTPPALAREDANERALARLTSAGMQAFVAQELLDAVDELALERLRRRYAEARGEDEEAVAPGPPLPTTRGLVESQFGEDAYDKYLYASGRGNRLVVRSVMANSPAENVGLRPGDRLISVAGRRVYSTRDLMQVISSAPAGQLALTFSRDDAVMHRLIPPGPLGISAGRESVNPGAEPGAG